MRLHTAQWFETKVKYDKQMEDGSIKPKTELYVVDAFSFTEAEETITDEASCYTSGEFDVKDIKKATYGEIWFSDNPRDDKWYKAKIMLIMVDEKTGKEKFLAIHRLVQSNTLQNAVKNIEEAMNGSMQDWQIASVAETAILDVFEHKTQNANQGKSEASTAEPEA